MSPEPDQPYSVAKGYVQSAYVLMANPLHMKLHDDTTFFLAFHMLCGFAAEFVFKAFLTHRGHSEAQLKQRHIGHDPARLRDQCRSEGLFDTGADTLVDLLAGQHKNFEYRYMKPAGQYRTMDLKTIFSAFSSLGPGSRYCHRRKCSERQDGRWAVEVSWRRAMAIAARVGGSSTTAHVQSLSITTNQAAIAALFRVMNRYVGNLPPMPGVFPDYPAPVIRNTGDGHEMTLMRWGMPPPPKIGGAPVTNIRNTSSAALAHRYLGHA